MSLQAKLDAIKEAGRNRVFPPEVPADVRQIMGRSTQALIDSGAAGKALKVGDKAPEFTLEDADGAMVQSAELLRRGPLVVSFYRGVWCPYCNADLQAQEAARPAIEALGASMVAISPQNATNSRKAMRQNALGFPILTDHGNAVAAAFGVRFAMPAELVAVYKAMKLDLEAVNGDTSWTLPMPGRFVIAPDGVIAAAEVDPDYSRRPEPEGLLPVLERRRATTSRAA